MLTEKELKKDIENKLKWLRENFSDTKSFLNAGYYFLQYHSQYISDSKVEEDKEGLQSFNNTFKSYLYSVYDTTVLLYILKKLKETENNI